MNELKGSSPRVAEPITHDGHHGGPASRLKEAIENPKYHVIYWIVYMKIFTHRPKQKHLSGKDIINEKGHRKREAGKPTNTAKAHIYTHNYNHVNITTTLVGIKLFNNRQSRSSDKNIIPF